jgi:hypothetical protein
MARWFVSYCPHLECDWASPGAELEIPCFRIYPEDDPNRWIAQTNPDLPPEVQEESALIIADALSKLLGA